MGFILVTGSLLLLLLKLLLLHKSFETIEFIVVDVMGGKEEVGGRNADIIRSVFFLSQLFEGFYRKGLLAYARESDFLFPRPIIPRLLFSCRNGASLFRGEKRSLRCILTSEEKGRGGSSGGI